MHSISHLYPFFSLICCYFCFLSISFFFGKACCFPCKHCISSSLFSLNHCVKKMNFYVKKKNNQKPIETKIGMDMCHAFIFIIHWLFDTFAKAKNKTKNIPNTHTDPTPQKKHIHIHTFTHKYTNSL